jgi:hypothetical protein
MLLINLKMRYSHSVTMSRSKQQQSKYRLQDLWKYPCGSTIYRASVKEKPHPKFVVKKRKAWSSVPEAQAFNPRFSGGRDQEDRG